MKYIYTIRYGSIIYESEEGCKEYDIRGHHIDFIIKNKNNKDFSNLFFRKLNFLEQNYPELFL